LLTDTLKNTALRYHIIE